MQSALGITDLGQFYHKPLRDSHGTVVLSCILNVKVGIVSVPSKPKLISYEHRKTFKLTILGGEVSNVLERNEHF
jgi:hypothetical protein